MVKLFRIAAPAIALVTFLVPAAAHEMWIAPFKYQLPAGKNIRADLRNGENFNGNQLAYFSRTSKRIEVAGPAGRADLAPRDGDRPAFDIDVNTPGLHVLAYESTPARITYKEAAKWAKFVKHKDLGEVAAQHSARGLPAQGFKEGYTRHAKALVASGSGMGADRELGLETEFVALTNPYDGAYSGQMSLKLLYKGKLRPNAQVEVFEQSDDNRVRVFMTRTNANGVASIRTKPGHSYLVDAVVLRVPESGDTRVAWETLWAALTFKHP
ncbi:MAG: DUF4198 domain-containing protein [Pseudomonadota bacterium]